MKGLLPSVAEWMPRKLVVRLVAYPHQLLEPELHDLGRFGPDHEEDQ
jgi:hypothetical protein